ncbi:uncharacterized protein EI97DRAFT_241700 [Westerdykella ornata]|uniref:Uncharacterized protein n=1 Tax=Westerdykella ornata TaxID=318751 RepID=A0A6A6J789_WESOR|nr:uncharacterized protein EI97DRAFT_241700 [Westerdykella ornata]KAF2271868.1 hypothetical protein EI97DRAFT_241700 [Westerdykella ornata]
MRGSQARSLELLVLQAHRAKGVRYPTAAAAEKEYFKTWYSYALRRGGLPTRTPPEDAIHDGKQLKESCPKGRIYL